MKLAILSTIQKLWTTAAVLLALMLVVMLVVMLISTIGDPSKYTSDALPVVVGFIFGAGVVWAVGRRWMNWMFGVKP